MPPSVEKAREIHPRLYLDTSRIAELRQVIHTTHAPMWKEVRERAATAVKRGPPGYRERDDYSGDEQLWQREVGNTMPVLAMAWVLFGERQYLDAARQWALASCGYPTWDLGRIDGMDLAAGHQLLGLGLVYDWREDRKAKPATLPRLLCASPYPPNARASLGARLEMVRRLRTRPPTTLSSRARSRPRPPARWLVLRSRLARLGSRQLGRLHVAPYPRS